MQQGGCFWPGRGGHIKTRRGEWLKCTLASYSRYRWPRGCQGPEDVRTRSDYGMKPEDRTIAPDSSSPEIDGRLSVSKGLRRWPAICDGRGRGRSRHGEGELGSLAAAQFVREEMEIYGLRTSTTTL